MTEPSKTSERVARIAVIPGDGVGVEVTAEATKVLHAVASVARRRLETVFFDWSADRYLRDGTTLPEDAPMMLRNDFEAILFGAVGDPRVPSNRHAAEILLGLRFKLDLYVNVRPCFLLDRRLTPLRDRTERDIQFTILRENTEGAYVGIGGIFKYGSADEIAVQEDISTRKGVERIIRYGFEYAQERGLTRLCMSDKSNALIYGGSLWQRVFAEVRAEYPQIESSHLFIDTLAAEMVRDPSQLQVIVTNNMFGDIVSDLGAQLIGGMGLAPSGNINPQSTSLFEPVHGSAPKIAGKNLANPLGSVFAAAMLLEHLGWTREAAAIRAAVKESLRQGKTTPDIGGELGTREVGDWLADYISAHSLAS